MYQPQISVAIPAYKPQFLAKAIESVLRQSFKDFELIIVNDASPFEIKKIVETFTDLRIKYFENVENLGGKNLVANWNKCLEYATGQYFVLFSDDDVMSPEFLASMFIFAERYPTVSVFHCRVGKINGGGGIVGVTPTYPEYETVIDFVWHTIRGYRNLFVSEFLVRTESLRKIGGFHSFPLAWASDYVTWFKLSESGGIVYNPEVLSLWRTSDYNISNKGSVEQRLLALHEYKIWLQKFLDHLNHSNEYQKYQLSDCLYKLNQFISAKQEHVLLQHLSDLNFIQKIVFFVKHRKHIQLNFFRKFLLVLKSTPLSSVK